MKNRSLPQASTSMTVLIWNEKGDIADCSTYRLIQLISHALKIVERIQRLRKIVNTAPNLCGFVKNVSAIDAVHAVLLLAEEISGKRRTVHAAFLDLEKACERVPHKVV